MEPNDDFAGLDGILGGLGDDVDLTDVTGPADGEPDTPESGEPEQDPIPPTDTDAETEVPPEDTGSDTQQDESSKSPETPPETPPETEGKSSGKSKKTKKAKAKVEPKTKVKKTVKAKRGEKPIARRAGRPRLPKLPEPENFVATLLRQAGLDEVPPLSDLVGHHVGETMKISDIAVFIGEPTGQVMQAIASKCKLVNRVNLTAHVLESQVRSVGLDILNQGIMFHPIEVARIVEDGAIECISGRHRLVFFALLYGADVSVPVYTMGLTLNQARDAVVFANKTRQTKTIEKAQHVVLAAVEGDITAKQAEMYRKTVTNKKTMAQYCVYSVIQRQHPVALGFGLGEGRSRGENDITTVGGLASYWVGAISWGTGTDHAAMDQMLKDSTLFLNTLAEAFLATDGFDPSTHCSTMTLRAIGKYYLENIVIRKQEPTEELAERIATVVVENVHVGRQPSEATYRAIVEAIG